MPQQRMQSSARGFGRQENHVRHTTFDVCGDPFATQHMNSFNVSCPSDWRQWPASCAARHRLPNQQQGQHQRALQWLKHICTCNSRRHQKLMHSVPPPPLAERARQRAFALRPPPACQDVLIDVSNAHCAPRAHSCKCS